MIQSQKDRFISVGLAALIISLGSARLPLTRLSSNTEHKYDYLPVTVNICAETIKFAVCFLLSIHLLYKEGRQISEIFSKPSHSTAHFLKWSIPGLLYFLDNLIGFYTLTYLEPAVAVLLNNFVIISTSILFRFILKVKFTKVQWASIIILFLAIVSLSNESSHSSESIHHQQDVNYLQKNTSSKSDKVICSYEKNIKNELLPTKHISTTEHKDSNEKEIKIFNTGHVLIIVSCFIASFANIYNEKIFKQDGGLQESIFFQNTKLYMFGVFFNVVTLLTHSDYRQRVWKCGFFDGYNVFSSILIFDIAFIGLTVSIILKFKDNMFHILSTQVMTVVVITFSIFHFGYNPTLNFYLQAPIVLICIYIYNVSKDSDGVHLSKLDEHENDTVYEEYAGKETTQNGIVSDQMELLLRHNSAGSGYDNDDD
ncbi:UDP-sugar transporter protein SLC35A5-like isoform X2 [Antedon mediterranea]